MVLAVVNDHRFCPFKIDLNIGVFCGSTSLILLRSMMLSFLVLTVQNRPDGSGMAN